MLSSIDIEDVLSIRVAVCPFGGIPATLVENLVDTMQQTRYLDTHALSYVSTLREQPFNVAKVRLDFYVCEDVHEAVSRYDEYSLLQPFTKTHAVLALCHCPQFENLSIAYSEFEQLKQAWLDPVPSSSQPWNNDASDTEQDASTIVGDKKKKEEISPAAPTIFRCYAFEPLDTHEDTLAHRDMIMFPDQDQSRLAFYLSTCLADLAVQLLRGFETIVVDVAARQDEHLLRYESKQTSVVAAGVAAGVTGNHVSAQKTGIFGGKSSKNSSKSSSNGSNNSRKADNSKNATPPRIKVARSTSLSQSLHEAMSMGINSVLGSSNINSILEAGEDVVILMSPLDEHITSARDAATNDAQQIGRRFKYAGDYCLLGGAPKEARLNFALSAEWASESADWIWHGGAMEGHALSLVQLEEEKKDPKFVPFVVELYSQAFLSYAIDRPFSARLAIEAGFRLVSYYTRFHRFAEAGEMLADIEEIARDCSPRMRTVVATEIAVQYALVRMHRKAALMFFNVAQNGFGNDDFPLWAAHDMLVQVRGLFGLHELDATMPTHPRLNTLPADQTIHYNQRMQRRVVDFLCESSQRLKQDMLAARCMMWSLSHYRHVMSSSEQADVVKKLSASTSLFTQHELRSFHADELVNIDGFQLQPDTSGTGSVCEVTVEPEDEGENGEQSGESISEYDGKEDVNDAGVFIFAPSGDTKADASTSKRVVCIGDDLSLTLTVSNPLATGLHLTDVRIVTEGNVQVQCTPLDITLQPHEQRAVSLTCTCQSAGDMAIVGVDLRVLQLYHRTLMPRMFSCCVLPSIPVLSFKLHVLQQPLIEGETCTAHVAIVNTSPHCVVDHLEIDMSETWSRDSWQRQEQYYVNDTTSTAQERKAKILQFDAFDIEAQLPLAPLACLTFPVRITGTRSCVSGTAHLALTCMDTKTSKLMRNSTHEFDWDLKTDVNARSISISRNVDDPLNPQYAVINAEQRLFDVDVTLDNALESDLKVHMNNAVLFTRDVYAKTCRSMLFTVKLPSLLLGGNAQVHERLRWIARQEGLAEEGKLELNLKRKDLAVLQQCRRYASEYLTLHWKQEGSKRHGSIIGLCQSLSARCLTSLLPVMCHISVAKCSHDMHPGWHDVKVTFANITDETLKQIQLKIEFEHTVHEQALMFIGTKSSINYAVIPAIGQEGSTIMHAMKVRTVGRDTLTVNVTILRNNNEVWQRAQLVAPLA